MEKKNISYEYVSFIVDLLEQRVDRDYDFIIGVGRGGLIPATMLAYKLKKTVRAIGIKTYDNMSQADDFVLYQSVDISKDKQTKVLVVDDICDTGNTFKIIKKMFNEHTHLDLEFASLFTKDKSSHLVDHYGLSVSDGMWLDFPWE